MNTSQYNELQKAIEFIKQLLRGKIDFDYSIYSVRNLDDIFVIAFKDGKLQNAYGKFAQHKGQILLGLSGYLTEVILKNTSNTKLNIDTSDEKWYLNFTLTAANGYSVQPSQQILKRISQGNEAALYAFAIATIKSFNETNNIATGRSINFKEVYFHDEANKKPWWKFW